MKTDSLLDALAADAPSGRTKRPAPPLAVALLGGLISLVLLLSTLGMRPDFGAALGDPHVAYKFALASLFAAAGVLAIPDLVRPDGHRRLWPLMLPIMGFAAFAFGLDLMLLDRSRWMLALGGDGPWKCILLILAFAIPPMVLLFAALRRGAPRSPARAGAAIGLLCGSVASAVFALNCTNDTALFVSLWYGFSIALVSGAGALVGRRLLAW